MIDTALTTRTIELVGPDSCDAVDLDGTLTLRSLNRSERSRLLAALTAADGVACVKCSRQLHDDDPSNTGLGYHVDCTDDGALAGQPS